MKRKLIIISSITLLVILSIVGIITLNNKRKIKEAIIVISYIENREVDFLSKVKVSDFIERINGKIVDDYEIDTTVIGDKNVEFEYINDDNIKVKQEFTINVVDRVAPTIWLSGSYSVNVGSDINLQNKILCADNYDDEPKCVIEGVYNLNKKGSYPLTYKAVDSSGNETIKEFKLNVVEPSKGGSTSIAKTNFSDIVKNYKNENTEIGLDISKWQGDVDFEKLREAGVEFVILRVGSANGIDKDRYIDSKFEQNITRANAAGIPVGIYYYSYAHTKQRAIEDALWVVEKIKDYKVDLPIAFDWENWSSYNNYHLSFYHLTEMAKSYLDVFKESGYEGMLYSSKTYLENMWMDTGYPVWLAHYTSKTNYEGKYIYWQMCNNGRVSGINGDVDIDIRYINK